MATKPLPAKKAAPKKSAIAIDKAKPTNTEPALLELFIDEIKDIYWAESIW